MKIILVVSSILGMAAATRVYCDLENTKNSGTSHNPKAITYSYSFNCNNDNNHNSETGSFDYTTIDSLPCNGCNHWFNSNGGGYQISPKQDDQYNPPTFWLKYQGKECNTNHGGGRGDFTIQCNV